MIDDHRPADQRCGACAFGWPVAHVEMPPFVFGEPRQETRINCRRFPPTFDGYGFEFPTMTVDDWCGEWKGKGER